MQVCKLVSKIYDASACSLFVCQSGRGHRIDRDSMHFYDGSSVIVHPVPSPSQLITGWVDNACHLTQVPVHNPNRRREPTQETCTLEMRALVQRKRGAQSG